MKPAVFDASRDARCACLILRLSGLGNAKGQNCSGTARDQASHPDRLELRAPAHKNAEDDATQSHPAVTSCFQAGLCIWRVVFHGVWVGSEFNSLARET